MSLKKGPNEPEKRSWKFVRNRSESAWKKVRISLGKGPNQLSTEVRISLGKRSESAFDWGPNQPRSEWAKVRISHGPNEPRSESARYQTNMPSVIVATSEKVYILLIALMIDTRVLGSGPLDSESTNLPPDAKLVSWWRRRQQWQHFSSRTTAGTPQTPSETTNDAT